MKPVMAAVRQAGGRHRSSAVGPKLNQRTITMTIDDFDVNEISDKLSIRDEADDNRTLEAAHNDGHNDFTISGCSHNDITNASSHDDHGVCDTHDDGHYDIYDHDDVCPPDGCVFSIT